MYEDGFLRLSDVPSWPLLCKDRQAKGAFCFGEMRVRVDYKVNEVNHVRQLKWFN